MFLKKKLEEKKNKLIAEYNPEPEKRSTSLSSEKKNKTQKFRLFQSKTDKLSFPLDHKKFNDDCVSDRAKIAKEYVKSLIDPDILELRKKRWNISSQPAHYEKPELKRTLFEVRHGLKDFNVTETKEKKIEIGTDTRNYSYEGWNKATILEMREKNAFSLDRLEKAKLNTLKYWKSNNDYRIAETLADLVEENQKSPKHKVFKKYINPVLASIKHNEMLQTIKRHTNDIRDNLREKISYENPAATSAKIEAIVYKEMFNTVRNEIKLRTGNNRPERKIKKEDPPKINESFLYSKIDNNTMKHDDFYVSKYPINYDEYKKINGEEQGSINREIELLSKSKTETKFWKKPFKKDDTYPADYESYKMTIEKRNEFEKENMFNKRAEEIRKREHKHRLPSLNQKKNYFGSSENSVWLQKDYSHPGTYTIFVFKERKNAGNNNSSSISNDDYVEKKLPAWSCCMNIDKNSKGCQKTIVNKLKWTLDSIP